MDTDDRQVKTAIDALCEAARGGPTTQHSHVAVVAGTALLASAQITRLLDIVERVVHLLEQDVSHGG